MWTASAEPRAPADPAASVLTANVDRHVRVAQAQAASALTANVSPYSPFTNNASLEPT